MVCSLTLPAPTFSHNDDDDGDEDDDEGHLLLCLPWDNWTLPDSELG